jgi:hypothetical protein
MFFHAGVLCLIAVSLAVCLASLMGDAVRYVRHLLDRVHPGFSRHSHESHATGREYRASQSHEQSHESDPRLRTPIRRQLLAEPADGSRVRVQARIGMALRHRKAS